MQFNRQWKDFLLESRETVLIQEARIKDIRGKYPILDEAGWIQYAIDNLTETSGPRAVSKYLLWYSRELHHHFDGEIEEGLEELLLAKEDVREIANVLLTLILTFEENLHKIEQKDIYRYSTSQLEQLLDKAGLTTRAITAAEKAAKAQAEQDSEVVYNNHGIIAIRPLTEQASCYYGENPRLTTWCISETEKRNYFNQYTQEDSKAFVIVKFSGIPEGDDNHIVALELDYKGNIETVWDAPNIAHSPEGTLDLIIEMHVYTFDEYNQNRAPEMTDEKVSALVNQIHEELLSSAKKSILDNPPPSPYEAVEKAISLIKAETESDLENIEVDWRYWHTQTTEIRYWATAQIDIDTRDASYIKAEKSLEKINTDVDLHLGKSLANERLERALRNRMHERGYGSIYENLHLLINEYEEVSIQIWIEGRPHQADNVEGFREFCNFTLPDVQKDLDDILQIAESVFMENGYKENPKKDTLSSMIMNEVDSYFENKGLTKQKFYDILEESTIKEEKGRSRQRGIYKFYCMLSYSLTVEGDKSRGLDDILADLRALPNVTIVTVVIKNQKISEGRYIAGLSVKFIPSVPGQFRSPEDVKSRITRDIRRLSNVHNIFKVSAGLERLE